MFNGWVLILQQVVYAITQRVLMLVKKISVLFCDVA